MKTTFGRLLFIFCYALIASSLTGCALVSTVEKPTSFSECPDITGTYLNENSIKNEKHFLNLSDFYFFQMGWLFRTFALERFHTMKAYHNMDTASDSSTIKKRMWEWPGYVHIFWIDKNKQILAVIFSSQFTIESGFITSLKEVEQNKTIFESRYVSLTNLDNLDERDNHTYFYCKDSKVRHEQSYSGLWVSVVIKVKTEISFDVDKNKNLISHQKWSKFEAILSEEGVEEGFWKATDWKSYQLEDVFPTSRIAAILSNLNGAIYSNKLVVKSSKLLVSLNALLSNADVELRYKENIQKSCEYLKMAKDLIVNKLNSLEEPYMLEVKGDIDTVMNDLACGNNS